jgi:hypothetical protein
MNQDVTFSARADVSGQNDQIALPWLPVAGRTYRPLIKSDKRPFLTKLAIAMVSPI